ncbi:MAG: hypothetical protein CMG13_00475 [Candidatus Marinimicrobia bacterium]|nr:hypothetical protein [Candidatus Neomarinimicrobiota bacterium]|tara:strand:- start:61 stop:783 length:723 start_codon:yes stop_codon:yes gene_type:complete
MILAGFIAPILIILLKKKPISEDHILAKSFILGLFFPSIGYCLNFLASRQILFFQKDSFLFLNSILLFTIIGISIYAYAEYRKRPNYKRIVKYLLLGLMAHSFLGYFFWIEKLNIFWPLNDKELAFSFVDYFFQKKQTKVEIFYIYYLSINLASLYFYGKFLITRMVNCGGSGEDIYRINSFLKFQRYLFATFLPIFFVLYGMQILNIDIFLSFFSSLYLILTIYCMYVNYKINFISIVQ